MTDKLQNIKGYKWIVEHNMVGFEPNTHFQPWYLLPQKDCFWVNDKWSDSSSLKLYAFARRQDNDDFACFNVGSGEEIRNIYIIHGCTEYGYDIVKSYSYIWDWMHSALDDIKELAEM